MYIYIISIVVYIYIQKAFFAIDVILVLFVLIIFLYEWNWLVIGSIFIFLCCFPVWLLGSSGFCDFIFSASCFFSFVVVGFFVFFCCCGFLAVVCNYCADNK